MSETNLFVILARHGVTVAAHERAEAAAAALNAAPRPPAPLPSVMDATPEQLAQHLVSVTHYAQLTDPKQHGDMSVSQQRRRLHDQLRAETRDAIRAEADEIVAQLRPAFDTAADAARRVIALGVKPTATVEDMLDATDAQRAAWREFRDQHAKTLDDILDARTRLSKTYAIAPVPNIGTAVDLEAVDWGACVLRPDSPNGLAARDPRAPHARWLAVADALHLPLPSEMNPTLNGTGLNTAEIISEARRRAAAGIGEDESTDSPTAGVIDARRPVWIPDPDDALDQLPTYPA